MVNHTSLLLRHGVFSHLSDKQLERLECLLLDAGGRIDVESMIGIWRQGDFLSIPQGSELYFRTNMLLMGIGREPIDACGDECILESGQDA